MTCLGVKRLAQFFCLFVGYDVILKGRICSIWSSVLPSCDDTRTLC